MKGAEPWVYDTPNGQVTVPASALRLDARGWITDLPVINGATTPVISNVFYGSIMPAGQFILEWQGEGTLET